MPQTSKFYNFLNYSFLNVNNFTRTLSTKSFIFPPNTFRNAKLYAPLLDNCSLYINSLVFTKLNVCSADQVYFIKHA